MEPSHGLRISAQHCDRHRRLPGAILGLDIRAQLDEQIENVVALAAHREMQRRLALLEARHAAIERFRILLDELPDQLEIARRDRRIDVVTRAALEQQRDDIPRGARFVENRRPSDDVELVPVAEAVDVGAGIEKRSRRREVGLCHSPM